MKTLILITSCVVFSLLSSKVSAQGHYPVIAMEVQSTDIANNLSNGLPDISDSTTFNVIMKVIVSDTISITNLQVVLKKSVNDQITLLSKTFTYDVFGSLPDGTSYTRTGYEITLNLGNYQGTIAPYAELIVANNNSNSDSIIYY